MPLQAVALAVLDQLRTASLGLPKTCPQNVVSGGYVARREQVPASRSGVATFQGVLGGEQFKRVGVPVIEFGHDETSALGGDLLDHPRSSGAVGDHLADAVRQLKAARHASTVTARSKTTIVRHSETIDRTIAPRWTGPISLSCRTNDPVGLTMS